MNTTRRPEVYGGVRPSSVAATIASTNGGEMSSHYSTPQAAATEDSRTPFTTFSERKEGTELWTARERLYSVTGDPFLVADWQRVVFLHFLVDPEFLRPYVPDPLELELYQGRGCFSVVALTMRRFRPCRWPSPGWLFTPIPWQRFLNFRTYVRRGDEPGALFLHGWLSQPLIVPLPSGMFGLPYAFAAVDYEDQPETGALAGVVRERARPESFTYRAPIEPQGASERCAPGSLAEFAMERYAGFFSRRDRVYVFRAWHPPWLQRPLDVEIKDASLLAATFPWFKEATLAAANFAPGFKQVQLGRARRLEAPLTAGRGGHRLSSFYQIP